MSLFEQNSSLIRLYAHLHPRFSTTITQKEEEKRPRDVEPLGLNLGESRQRQAYDEPNEPPVGGFRPGQRRQGSSVEARCASSAGRYVHFPYRVPPPIHRRANLFRSFIIPFRLWPLLSSFIIEYYCIHSKLAARPCTCVMPPISTPPSP